MMKKRLSLACILAAAGIGQALMASKQFGDCSVSK